MRKPIHKSVLITLNEGDTQQEKDVTLDSGDRVFALGFKDGNSNEAIRVAIEENGSEVHPPMNIKAYNGNFGSFKQRAMELNHNGGATLTVRASTLNPIAAGEKAVVEVDFMIEKAEKC